METELQFSVQAWDPTHSSLKTPNTKAIVRERTTAVNLSVTLSSRKV